MESARYYQSGNRSISEQHSNFKLAICSRDELLTFKKQKSLFNTRQRRNNIKETLFLFETNIKSI